MKTLIAAGLSLAIAATAAPAFAKGGGSDQDGDGRISLQEFQAKQEHQFQRLDKDGNGQVSRAEYDRKLERKMKHKAANGAARSGKRGGGKDRFAKLDLNGDQVLTMDEFRQSVEKRFARRDRDGQGYITPAQGKHASR